MVPILKIKIVNTENYSSHTYLIFNVTNANVPIKNSLFIFNVNEL